MALDPSSGLNIVGISELQPVVDVLNPVLTRISILVGGIFSLYLIMVLVKIYFEHRRTRTLEDIRFNTDQLNMHFNVPYSKNRLGLIKRVTRKIKGSIKNKDDEEI